MAYTANKENLEDFGEKIDGAKKDTYQFRHIDLSDKETRKLPLSKLWDKKEIEAIEDKQIASIAYVLRENLPNKPRNEYKLNSWFKQLAEAQAIVNFLSEKHISAESVTDKLLESKSSAGDKIYLLSQIDRKDWGLVDSVNVGTNYLSGDGISPSLNVKINGTRHELVSDKNDVKIHNLSVQDKKNIIDNAVEQVKKHLEQANQDLSTSSNNKTSNVKFDVYYYRDTGIAFIVSSADRQKTPLVSGFDTIAEAKEYRDNNLPELHKLWVEHKEQNTINKSDMRNQTNEERTGQSYRDGDITPEQFMETFGVRGGQFGNWVNNDERQKMLNATYDGFMDLAKALEVEPKAIGLDGNLAIAFGARGSGWASAHYEQNETVINLTKTRGAGSLAHEWWHALDHYMNNHGSKLLTENTFSSSILHRELKEPVDNLISSIRQSDLYGRSLNADGYRNRAYFATKEEMTARAFEAVVIQLLKEQGIKNDFLANVRAETDWAKNDKAYPYPRQNEIETFKQSYLQIFDTLKEVNKEFVHKEYEVDNTVHSDTIEPIQLNITVKNFDNDPASKEVQDRVIHLATTNAQALLDTYRDMNNTFNGRYIASDMMKEVFSDFNQSPAHRNQFNNAVHNSAATLSAEHFKQMLNEAVKDGRDTVVFLTGCPGAGKTTSVMRNGSLKENVGIVFEGQLANAHQNPATMDKIQQALDKGFKVEIVAVNPLPEQALENTFKRFYDPNDGRGASISTMARIQGNTYDGLKAIHEKFGEQIGLTIVDKPFGNEKSQKYTGWENLNVVKSQGNEAEITQRLETHLLHHYAQGNIDYECFKQSAGSKERAEQLVSRLDRRDNSRPRENSDGRELSPSNSQESNEQRTGYSSNPSQEYRQTSSETKQPSTLKNQRTYLYSTPKDSEELKSLGARYDIANKAWFITSNQDPSPFSQWTNRPNIPTPEELLAQHLKAQGVLVPAGHPMIDGKQHRLSNDGSKEENVLYHGYLNPNGLPFVAITNWSRGSETERWTYPMEYKIARDNMDIVDRLNGNPNYQRESRIEPSIPTIDTAKNIPAPSIDDIKQYDSMAEKARLVISFAPIANQHNYLDRKQVTSNDVARVVPDKSALPDDLKDKIAIANDWKEAIFLRENNPDNKIILQKGNLIIPQYNMQGELRAFETISNYNSNKYALQGAERKGLTLPLGDVEKGNAVIIAEGYATGATLYEQANVPVLVAFGKNNLEQVATQLRELYPEKRIYISADNDHKNEAKGLENGGIKEATAVAEKINATVLIPRFEVGDTGKDWNDVYVDKGKDEFLKQLKSELARNGRTAEVETATSKFDLSPERIAKDYPNLSPENKAKIQEWNSYLSDYGNPKVEDSRGRLEALLSNESELNKVPTLAEYQQQKSMSSPSLSSEKPLENTQQTQDKGNKQDLEL